MAFMFFSVNTEAIAYNITYGLSAAARFELRTTAYEFSGFIPRFVSEI